MNGDQIYAEMEKEINNMNLEQLLYVRMAPQTFINKKFESKIKDSQQLIHDIEVNNQNIKRNEEEINKQNALILQQCNQLKMEIEQSKNRINELIVQKNKLNRQPKKEDFIKELDMEIKKNLKTPDNYFKEFLSKSISENEFCENLKNLGTGKNYYYYKILSDKLKEM